MTKIGFITLGCPKNEADTAHMRTLIEGSAYELVDDVESADIAIINTCGFITSATEESLECIFDLVRDWVPAGKGRHVVVVGCLTSRYGEKLSGEIPEVSLFLGVKDEKDILVHLDALTGMSSKSSGTHIARRAEGPSEYVMIADGCDKKCSYCTIPSIRGPYVSRPLEDVVEEVRGLIETGAREIILIAQDTSRYGFDLAEDVTLATLIDALGILEGLEWLRIMYVQPDGLTDELLDAMERNDKVAWYFEVPMQHANHRILRDMGRGGDGNAFLAKINEIRRRFPDAVIRTTLIAGYPTESEGEFQELVDFVKQAQLDYVGVFPYSPEEGTAAADHTEHVADEVRQQRAQTLRDIAEEISFGKNVRWAGRTIDVLVEGVDDEGQWFGRFEGQAPDIDGIVRFDMPQDVNLDSGMIIPVQVEDTFLFDLEGTIDE